MAKWFREISIWLCTWPMRALYRLLGLRYFYTAWQSVKPTAQLYRSARDSLYIVAGELNADVWNTEAIKEALTELVSREHPPDIKIVFGPRSRANKHALDCLRSFMRQHKLQLYTVPDRRLRHFVVADGLHVKIEEPHAPEAQIRHGYVDYNNPELAAELLASVFPAEEGRLHAPTTG